MKTLKLVIGILCMALAIFVVFQSCAAGVGNALADNGESGGTGGLLVAILMVTGGVVMLVTRKQTKKGGSVASMIIFLLAAVIGWISAGSYSDLNVWAWLCMITAVINLISLFLKPKTDA